MSDWLDFIRGIVRPAVTMAAVLATIIMLFIRVDIPEFWIGILSALIAYYFASRDAARDANRNRRD